MSRNLSSNVKSKEQKADTAANLKFREGDGANRDAEGIDAETPMASRGRVCVWGGCSPPHRGGGVSPGRRQSPYPEQFRFFLDILYFGAFYALLKKV